MKLIWHKRAEKHLFNSAAYTTREFGKATADFKLIYYINVAKERIIITNFWDVRRDPQRLIEETK